MVEPDLRMAEISDVLYSREIGHDARSQHIRVLGSPGASFNLSVTRATSTTDNTPASWFDFETHTFQSNVRSLEAQIPRGGKFTQSVEIPLSKSAKNYNVVVTPLLNADKTKPATFGVNVPRALGDATMKQRGIKTITIRPITDTAANFGTIPTQDVSVPALFSRNTRRRPSRTVYGAKGGNNNKSSNKITISASSEIRAGSVLLTKYADYSIPHNTTVIGAEENLITLSNAVSIPDNSDLQFLLKRSATVPFSFEIPVKGSFTVNSNVNYEANVFAGNKVITLETNGAVAAGKIITLAPGSRGVEVGMAIIGDNLVNTSGYDYLRVDAVDVAARTVNVGVNQDIPDGTALAFVYPESLSSSDSYDVLDGVHKLSLAHMQTSSSDGKLMVEGYFDLFSIGKDASNIDILIDDFITIH
jgi:hypothetical protein